MLTCPQGRVLSPIFIQDYNALTPVYHGLFSVSLNMIYIYMDIFNLYDLEWQVFPRICGHKKIIHFEREGGGSD